LVRNQLGQVIKSQDFISGSQEISIDLNDQVSGTYFLQIQSDNLVVTKRVTVIK